MWDGPANPACPREHAPEPSACWPSPGRTRGGLFRRSSSLQAPAEGNPVLSIRLVENVDVLDGPSTNSRDALRQCADLGLQRRACRSLCLLNSDEYRTP